jgi:acetyl-CoA carboxylase biotin carboxyl carrier protein
MPAEKPQSRSSAAKVPASLPTKTKPSRKSAMSESDKTSSETAKSEKGGDSVFAIDRIRRLVELMKEHDLSEVDLRESRQRIRICRGPKEAPRPAAAAYAAPSPAAATPAAIAAPAADAANIVVIKSPMVGTFYSRPNPKAEPYVKAGDRVDTTTVVCIIEAMKVFNEIPAETRGKIVAVLCDDGEAVEFDKPLFKVDTSS